MKITKTALLNVAIADISQGECFLYNNTVYMKTDEGAVNLETGTSYTQDSDLEEIFNCNISSYPYEISCTPVKINATIQ